MRLVFIPQSRSVDQLKKESSLSAFPRMSWAWQLDGSHSLSKRLSGVG